jgi:hypothetical protein
LRGAFSAATLDWGDLLRDFRSLFAVLCGKLLESETSFGRNAFSSMSSPSVDHRVFAVSRAGHGAAEYEDAAAVALTDWPVCAAVADGATESVFAGAWAERLARGLVERRATTAGAFREVVAQGQSAWRATVRDRSKEEPWYVSAKAAEGAFAALLGLSLHPNGRWRAVSVGDCCLFHVRDGALVQSWPFDSPDSFTNRPALISSRSDQDLPSPETISGTWRPRDTFLLATDAVAAWLLEDETSETSQASFGLSDAADWNQEDFRRIVETAREKGALRNDDATLLMLRLNEAPGTDENPSKS